MGNFILAISCFFTILTICIAIAIIFFIIPSIFLIILAVILSVRSERMKAVQHIWSYCTQTTQHSLSNYVDRVTIFWLNFSKFCWAHVHWVYK
jgi:hypothetical protein